MPARVLPARLRKISRFSISSSSTPSHTCSRVRVLLHTATHHQMDRHNHLYAYVSSLFRHLTPHSLIPPFFFNSISFYFIIYLFIGQYTFLSFSYRKSSENISDFPIFIFEYSCFSIVSNISVFDCLKLLILR